uniref:Uncharacterized protein n=1 Tax=Lotharella oceanica TaxID=641309 RepID=A0A7S2TU81_9EUKA|mmetsp:Transcript_30191/g.56389  ORF Transcript_30191/g.56389 Transcript_30191/m.56389 type:complete len:159 (+) Transcript_30191:113-589(+)|eukprot:CAMPEP_0170189016 /NCGR_PEP_ID=MMETSP0040_2-20121228/45777_1 /TAXON_ID=641309 /ORGANISM="Lotharella oceanica, Strain CCMP622" /LENGTH=158 /DNA_ID=CAMNT_0010436469 /DNA_START=34 /DNA_END=510 /DNA_ORIENTATION=+
MAHRHATAPPKTSLKSRHRIRRSKRDKGLLGSQELIVGSPAIRDSPLSLELGLVRKINTFGCSAPLQKSLLARSPKRKLSRSWVKSLSPDSHSPMSASCRKKSCLSPLADRTPTNALFANARTRRSVRNGKCESKRKLKPAADGDENGQPYCQFRLEL